MGRSYGENIKRNDQINLLEIVAKFTDTGEWEGALTYPGCGFDLVQHGFATEDKKITKSGRAALWLLGKGPDPTDSKTIKTFLWLVHKDAQKDADL